MYLALGRHGLEKKGAMAEAFCGEVPADIQKEIVRRLDDALRAELFPFACIHGVQLLVDKEDGGEK